MADEPLETPGTRIQGRRILADALKTFIFSMSEGLSNRGRRNQSTGAGAALAAPFKMQQMAEAQRLQQEQQRVQADAIRRAAASQDFEAMMKVINETQGRTQAPTVPLTVPGAQAIDPRAQGQVFQGDTQMGPQQLPPFQVKMPGGQTQQIPRQSEQDVTRILRQRADDEQQAQLRGMPPAAPTAASNPQSRNVERNGKKFIEYFFPNDPSRVIATVEAGELAKPAEPNTPFEVWREKNQNADVSEFYRLSQPPSANAEPTVVIPSVDAEGNPITRVMPRSQAQSIGSFPSAPTAEQRNRVASLGRIEPVLDGISELSEKINTGSGIIAKAEGVAAKAAARANYNDDVAEYEALISGFTPMVARAVGHVGVLTEQDVQSVKSMFPRPGDSKTLRDRKLARIKSIIGSSPQPSGSGNMVNVIMPDGRSGQVPSDKLQEAIKRGAKVQ